MVVVVGGVEVAPLKLVRCRVGEELAFRAYDARGFRVQCQGVAM